MPESGSSGSVRGVLSNEHPYREPGPIPAIAHRQPRGLRWVAACDSNWAICVSSEAGCAGAERFQAVAHSACGCT